MTGGSPLVSLAEDDEDVEADRQRGRQAGADAQLDKPSSPAVLAERVRELLEAGST